MHLNDPSFLYTERLRSASAVIHRAGAYQQPYQLHCSHPTLTQWWWFYNRETLVRSPRVQVLKNGTLHFVSLKFEDAGSYICSVKGTTNGYWTIYVDYDLDVYGKHS